MNYPLISVILPVFNSELFLAESIDSILDQTYENFELLIIYDESTDGSYSIIERYLNRDNRIKLIYGYGKGLIGALNQGIESSKGEFIARMDADDVSLPERFEKQIQLLISTNSDICGCHWFVINEIGKLIDAKLVPLCQNTLITYLTCTVPFAHGSVIMRREFIQKNRLKYGGVRYAEDYDLWLKFYENGASFVNVNEFLFKYRELSSSLSKKVKYQNSKDSKFLRRHFINQNLHDCLIAIRHLTENYANLSQQERVYLLLSSYLLSIVTKKLYFIKVFRRSTHRSIGFALLYLFRGM
jgi:glycosyltransferase involved in cell wall biosynthesis